MIRRLVTALLVTMATGSMPVLSPPAAQTPSDPGTAVQNAILEGIQFSTEDVGEPGDRKVICYFIFIDKPSSYFYELRRNPDRFVIDFNDTKRGTAPISTDLQPPVTGFDIEEIKVDMNRDIKGLAPDLRDVVRITFRVTDIPKVLVTDQYNIISFDYLWSDNPAKNRRHNIVKDNSMSVFWWSGGILGGIGGTTLALYLLGVIGSSDDGTPKEIPIDDLPGRPLRPQ